MENIGKLIESFMTEEFPKKVEKGNEDIYNEFSLQYELGKYLNNLLPPKYKVQFERNITFFDPKCKKNKEHFGKYAKKEIDISIFDSLKKEKCAIELKYPTNGQHPKQLYKFCEDICFMEQVKEFAGFQQSYVLTLVNDDRKGKSFYEGKGDNGKTEKVYNRFCRLGDGRRRICIESGEIEYPIDDGHGPDEPIFIMSDYETEWQTVAQHPQYHYYLLSIKR